MDWNHQIEQHREMLQRIVALLFALADLADRASGRSRSVRCEVLFILSHGEAVAREFILEEAQASGMPIPCLPAPAHDDGCSAGDAVQLAARLRALAAILAYIWAQTLPSRASACACAIFCFRTCSARLIQRAKFCAMRRGVGFRALDSPFLGSG